MIVVFSWEDSTNSLVQESLTFPPNGWGKIAIHSNKYIAIFHDKVGIVTVGIKHDDSVGAKVSIADQPESFSGVVESR